MINLSLELLNTFLAVQQTGAVTKAAAMLHTTQSNVSMRIAVLEQQLGSALFDRSRRPWALTDAGEVFFSYAKEFKARANELENTVQEIAKGQAGECRIGGSLSVANFLLPRLIGHILEAHPRIGISLDSRGTTAAIEETRRGEMHFAFILARGPIADLTCTEISDEDFVFIASPEYARSVMPPVSVQRLRRLPLAIMTQKGEMNAVLGQALGNPYLSHVKIAVRMTSIVGIKELARSIQCVGLVPRLAAEQEITDGTLAEIPVRGIRLALKMFLVEHPSFVHSPTVELVKTLLLGYLTDGRRVVPA